VTGYIAEEFTVVSTNVPKNDYTEFNTASIYTKGERFTVEADGMNYYVSQDCEAGLVPSENKNIFSSSPMNYLKMFRYDIDNVTSNPELIEVVIRCINIDSITLAQLVAKEVEIVGVDKDTGAVIYEKTFDLVEDELDDFADYLFSEQELTDKLSKKIDNTALDAVIESMTSEQIITRFTATPPIYYDTEFTISIKNPGGVAECGAVCVGREIDLGSTMVDGVTMGEEEYEVIEEKEEWDETSIESGYSYETMELSVILKKGEEKRVFSKLKKLKGKVVVFRGIEHEDYEYTTIIGKYKDIQKSIDPFAPTYQITLLSYIKDFN